MLWPNMLRVSRNMCGAAAIFVFVAATAAAQMSMPVDTPGLGSGGNLPVAIGVHTISNSGAGIATSGNNLCLLNAACVFSGTPDTFSQFQFTGLQVTGTLQDINDQKGTSGSFSGTPTNAALLWEADDGTVSGTGLPGPITTDGPVAKFSRIENMSSSNCSSAVDNQCNATVAIWSTAVSTSAMQNAGLFVGATNSIAAGQCYGGASCHALAAHFEGRITGSAAYKAAAAEFLAKNNSSSAAAGLLGISIENDNNSGSDCTIANYTSSSNCDGLIWADSGGTNKINFVLHVGNGGGGINEGLTFNQGSIVNITYDDLSTSATSINIGGLGCGGCTHATAAINVNASAGNVYFGNNTFSMSTTSSLCSPSSCSVNGGGPITNVQYVALFNRQTAPVLFAQGDMTTGYYQRAAGEWRFQAGGTDVIDWSSSGEQILSGGLTISSPAPTVTSGQIGYGGTTATVSHCNITTPMPAGCIVVNVAGTTRYVPYY